MLTGQIVQISVLFSLLGANFSLTSQHSLLPVLALRVGEPCPLSLLLRTRIWGSEAKRVWGDGEGGFALLSFPMVAAGGLSSVGRANLMGPKWSLVVPVCPSPQREGPKGERDIAADGRGYPRGLPPKEDPHRGLEEGSGREAGEGPRG